MEKQHYLMGVIHTGTIGNKRVLTTWTTTAAQARKEKRNLSHIGADKILIMRDGRIGYKIVGYFGK